MTMRVWVQRTWGLVFGLLLMGCASVMRVDSQVQAHALWAKNELGDLLASKHRYEFERLPSQQNASVAAGAPPPQAEMEGLTREVLASKGWRERDPVADVGQALPRWRVQVSASQQTLPRAPWDDPSDHRWLRPRAGVGATNAGLHFNVLLRAELPYFVRSVSLVIRDTHAQGRVVYETQAVHDGRWPDRPDLWRAMMEAALRDFPQPPAGVQRIDIDIPR